MTEKKRQYIYATVFPVFAAAGQQIQTIVVDNDADFMAISLTFCERVAAPALANYTLVINDTKSSQNWWNVPLPILNTLDGTGQLPYTFAAARWLPRRTTITVQLNAAAASVALTIDITVAIHGYKLYV